MEIDCVSADESSLPPTQAVSQKSSSQNQQGRRGWKGRNNSNRRGKNQQDDMDMSLENEIIAHRNFFRGKKTDSRFYNVI